MGNGVVGIAFFLAKSFYLNWNYIVILCKLNINNIIIVSMKNQYIFWKIIDRYTSYNICPNKYGIYTINYFRQKYFNRTPWKIKFYFFYFKYGLHRTNNHVTFRPVGARIVIRSKLKVWVRLLLYLGIQHIVLHIAFGSLWSSKSRVYRNKLFVLMRQILFECIDVKWLMCARK